MKIQLRHVYVRQELTHSGFTLLEFMVVVAMVAVLSAIAAPVWIRFLDTQRLASVQDAVYQGIQQAQSKAQQTHSEWQFSIREASGALEWSVHPAMPPSSVSTWNSLGYSSIVIDSETTLQSFGIGHTVRFDHRGNVVSRLGRVTLSSNRVTDVKRCVYVSTLIGALRQAKQQSTPRDDDFCY